MLSVFGRRIKGMIRLRPEQVCTCNVTLHVHTTACSGWQCRTLRQMADRYPSEQGPSGGWRRKMIRGKALRTRRQAFSLRFKTVDSYWSRDCIPNGVYVTVPGRSEGSKAATTPRRLQLCTVLGSSVNKLPCRYCATTIVIDTSFLKKLKITAQNAHNRCSLPCRGHLTTGGDQLQNCQPSKALHSCITTGECPRP